MEEKIELDEVVYSIRNNKNGTVKSIDEVNGIVKGYTVYFSKNKFDYEYHYPSEIRKVDKK